MGNDCWPVVAGAEHDAREKNNRIRTADFKERIESLDAYFIK
jgi:hypothetical protein